LDVLSLVFEDLFAIVLDLPGVELELLGGWLLHLFLGCGCLCDRGLGLGDFLG